MPPKRKASVAATSEESSLKRATRSSTASTNATSAVTAAVAPPTPTAAKATKAAVTTSKAASKPVESASVKQTAKSSRAKSTPPAPATGGSVSASTSTAAAGASSLPSAPTPATAPKQSKANKSTTSLATATKPAASSTKTTSTSASTSVPTAPHTAAPKTSTTHPTTSLTSTSNTSTTSAAMGNKNSTIDIPKTTKSRKAPVATATTPKPKTVAPIVKATNVNNKTASAITTKQKANSTKSSARSRPSSIKATPSDLEFDAARCIAWFATYTGLEEDEDFGTDQIGPGGIGKLCEDIGVSLDKVDMLVLAQQLNADTLPIFTKAEWIQGMTKLKVDSSSKLQVAMRKLLEGLQNPATFKDFYRYVFMFAKDSDQKCMRIETAAGMLGTVLEGRPHVKKFLEYLEEKAPVKVINKDQWHSFLDFSDTVSEDLSNYDAMSSSWPVLLDEYATWRTESN